MDKAKELDRLRGERDAADEVLKAADHAFKVAIRDALNDGMTALQIAEATGLSRPRVYQIRDGRR